MAADDLEVEIKWQETVYYTSTVRIAREELEEYATETEQPIDAALVKEFLTEGDEEEWFRQVNTNKDFDYSQERYIQEVQL